jgi:hypothetical protein
MSIVLVQPLNTGVSEMVPFGSSSLPATPLFITTDDTVAEVTASGYLSEASKNFVTPIADKQAAWVYTTDGGMQAYQVSVSGAVVSLIPAAGSKTGSVTDGHFAVFSGGAGTLKDAGYHPSDPTLTRVVMSVAGPLINRIAKFMDTQGTVGPNGSATGAAINAGDIQAGLTGGQSGAPVFGRLIACPPGANSGSLNVQAGNNAGNFVVAIINNSHAQNTSHYVPDTGLTEDAFMMTSLLTPDAASNLICFDVPVTAAALAGGGAVTIYQSTGTKQYRIRSLWINAGGTNFSGGGGDRLLDITDNTTVYSSIPAATLGTLVNAGWGDGTDLPYPAAAAINQATAAGQAILAKYSGGAADFSAGSVTISGVLERIA